MNSKPVKTLMVEDAAVDAAYLSGVLASSDYFSYQVALARSMGQTRQQLAAGTYDLVLLDLRLPNGQGVALVREVRGLAKSAALVIVTGCEHDEEEIEALQAMADEYIRKGKYSPDQMGRLIRNSVIRVMARRETAALDDVQTKLDQTLATCVASPLLPPYAEEKK